MQCPRCQFENPEASRFCNQCATLLIPLCSACGHENACDAKFCNQCATSLISSIPATATPGDTQLPSDVESRLHALLPEVIALIERDRRVTYRRLQFVFAVDDGLLQALKKELAFRQVACDANGEGLVWTGADSSRPVISATKPVDIALPSSPPPFTATPQAFGEPTAPVDSITADVTHAQSGATSESERTPPEAERRQITVMFCDLADSTKLSQHLDPEDLRDVVRAYQATAAAVIEQYEGHMAQYLGDGLLIYFGWPIAHEDDTLRALHSGLGIVDAITNTLNPRLLREKGIQLTVRLGVHTGPVVVGEMGGGERLENLATGETVNIAARLEGIAEPNTVLISNVTARLVQGAFSFEELGPHALKGVAQPVQVYRVLSPSEAQVDEDERMSDAGVFLVGRDEEVGLLLRRWEQSKEGLGQVVLISGEAGLGKSSLLAAVRHHVVQEGFTRMTFRCSPYHTNSAFYPVIDHIQRYLQFQPDDSPQIRINKLESALSGYSRPLEEVVPLYADLLSIPVPEGCYPELNLTPQQQRVQTQDALVGWMLEEAERQPSLAMWEDLHWADPSTLEMLGLLLEQTPTVPMLHVLTYRPEFDFPWPMRTHMTPITLNRLELTQVEALVTHLVSGKDLPEEVRQHIVSKTDGVPLYVEELTKMLLDSDMLQEEAERYVLTGPLLTIAIPDTLQDSLMARLDQMNTAKEVAQLGSVLGREFTYEMLYAISSQDEETLRAGLSKLVEAELLYQRGRPPRSRYIFKHALIQDAAYQSLLRSTRQQYHSRIATVLESQFPDTAETQPELLAHHFTEAHVDAQAVRYWQEAGRRAVARSAYAEAIHHFENGLAVLSRLPDTVERTHEELTLQMGLGRSLMLTKGYGAPELEPVYVRAQELAEHVGDTRRLIGASTALWSFYLFGGQLPKARMMAEKDLRAVSHDTDSRHLVSIHNAMAQTLYAAGELAEARDHFEEAIQLYDRHNHRLRVTGVQDYGVTCRSHLAWVLWRLGYPDQALLRSREALDLAHEVEHPYTLAAALSWSIMLYCDLRQVRTVMQQTETTLTLATGHKFDFWLAMCTIYRGWAMGMQGQAAEGMDLMQKGLAVVGSTWAEAERVRYPVMLAEMYGISGQPEKGLEILAEIVELIDRNPYRLDESERYRLKGELLRQQSVDNGSEAECCFHNALTVARDRQSKSLELRAAVSLAGLWESLGKRQVAYDVLAPVYGWFTEGFDTVDLQDAKTLLLKLQQ